MTNDKQIRAGDVVRHIPSGETWVVAAVSVHSDHLYPAGWPETMAEISDCEMVTPATDEKHVKMLLDVLRSKHTGAREGAAFDNLIDVHPSGALGEWKLLGYAYAELRDEAEEARQKYMQFMARIKRGELLPDHLRPQEDDR